MRRLSAAAVVLALFGLALFDVPLAPGARGEAVGPDDPFAVEVAPPKARTDTLELPVEPLPAVPEADLRTMIGQMLIVGFIGTTPGSAQVQRLHEQIRAGDVGGAFFLGRNVSSREQVMQLTRYFLSAGAPQPPFIAIDQEGGFVQRLSRQHGFMLIPSALRMASLHGATDAEAIYTQAARELAEAGFNLNFSPVVDLNTNPDNPIIGQARRSYGTDPQAVALYARALIEAHAGAGVLTSLKHFPGHGSSRTDSHDQLVDITRSWAQAELEPYRALIAAGYDGMVMIGHLYNAELDPGGRRPATFSAPVIEGLLRGTLGFDGVVVTDDLEMGAIRRNYALEETVVSAIAAGNDVLLFSRFSGASPDLPERVHAIVEAAIADGRLTRERIARSYARIVALKARLARR